MINTSIAFRRALSENREFRIKDTITLKNKKEIPIPMMDLREYKINEATSASGKFEIGAAVIKEYKVTLDNSEEQYDDCDFEGANIQAVIGLKLADGTWEDLKKGLYRVYTATFGETTLQITAYDEMIYFDRPYSECTLSYPATVRDIVLDACRHCQVDCESGSIEMGNYIVKTKPEGSITYRDVISYCAQIMGCYARINHLGRLAFGWYDFSAVGSGDLDGGIFDTASQEKYLSGDEADGGTFDDYSSGYTYDGGSFADMDTYHHFYDLYNKSINGTDINVTGIQITTKKDSADEKYLYGTNTYALEIKDNPLIQTDTMQQVAKHIGDKIINKPFRPMSVSIQGNPAIEAGDVAVVSPKTTSSYTTVITDTTFSLFAAQSISSTAETPTAKTFTRYGAATKLLEAARNYTDQEMSAYDLVVQQMNQLAANTMGFHETKIIQDDGSVIVYRHDKPKLSESKIVYKSGIDGFFVTKNYTGKDSTTVWKAGFDSNGNAALNILSVIGIHWDWAYGGTLSLGGVGNGNGIMKVFDSNGVLISTQDINGYFLYDKNGLIKAIINKDSIRLFSTPLNPNVIEESSYEGIQLNGDGFCRIGGTYCFDDGELSMEISDAYDPFVSLSSEIDGNVVGNFDELLAGVFWATNATIKGGTATLDSLTSKATKLLNVKQNTNAYDLLLMTDGTVTRAASSSKRYKDIGDAISEMDIDNWYKIEPVWAKYKDGYLAEGDENEGRYLPMFIAEDVEKCFPQAVAHDGSQVEDWNYRMMIPAMFAMIKQQKEEIESLKQAVKEIRGN
ncbi:tail fiber domain-containing protein [Blautia sp. 2744]|uniref:Tail fiber domain-containing protein n=1 Tax=Blautia intestinalis TaxID=2763028 RepID=A0ABR7I4S8_9FIRM|nr:tail fiber domain-containing protein [Blautia intestinalis]MBC5741516.1 tail fiber domain-containing protein [Blautia intestinalis]RHD30490.1 tail fiber domain-containing protein [Blautia obeum]